MSIVGGCDILENLIGRVSFLSLRILRKRIANIHSFALTIDYSTVALFLEQRGGFFFFTGRDREGHTHWGRADSNLKTEVSL